MKRQPIFTGEELLVTVGLSMMATFAVTSTWDESKQTDKTEQHISGVPLCSGVITDEVRLEAAGEMDPELAREAGQKFCSIGKFVFFYYPLEKEPEAPKSSPPTGTDEV